MAKKKEEEVKKGLDEWMGTFSDMMTLLMCFFVMLFAMSSVDAAKFEAVANSFQSTFSIFKGGAQAIGDGILVSNGVSQLNQLDEYINSTGKTADSESDTVDFKEDKASAVSEKIDEIADQLGVDKEELQDLESAMEALETEKMKLSEQMAERMEEALQESMMQEIVDVEFTSDYVLLTLNGAFLFDSGRTDLKEEAIPVLNKIGVLLTRYADSDIEIEGHTDSVPLNGGKYENNDVLSSYRALAVFNYLKDNSAIDPSIMKHSGRGEYMPIADNSTPEGRAKNRRVEIKVFNALGAN
ncbi:MAG: flagellar motor protein MotB [Lachnospiraceae bacterium]|jgi:Flagellar motor protein|nr:flagellar motor protein MotB [Lachnospiraceae bacterium]MCI9400216.1 flagellar motor protein MotB [Lachnospiraceae bacterium]MCX4375268.1 flagellar motor protein MotB [Lachnospiraceae bacterium]